MGYFFVTDVTLSESEDGQPRVNVGDQQSGAGLGAALTVWGSGDGFVGLPNTPSGASSAQALVYVDGHVQRVVAVRDTRIANRAGTLAPGDRAIVSDSEAWLLLDQSADSIALRSSGSIVGEMTVTVDGANNRIRLTVGTVSLTIDATGVDVTGGVLKVGGVTLTVP